MQLIALLLVTAFGFALQGRLHVGLKTGVFPLVGIIVLALTMKADASGEAALAAGGLLRLLITYALLMWVGFNGVASGRLGIQAFVNAFLIGVAGTAVLQPFLGAITTFESFTYHPFRGHFAYLAVMAFGVAYARSSMRAQSGGNASVLDHLLVLVFLCLTAVSYSRAVWIAALWVFALVSLWSRRKTFWIVASLFVIAALTVPAVGGRILPEGSTVALSDSTSLARITTGRSMLWGRLWESGVEGLPFGQGWGYVPSLSSIEIFGFEGNFQSGTSTFVYPHNDFLYLFVDLGILGAVLLIAFWLGLVRRIRRLSRERLVRATEDVRVLVPVLIVMFVVQLFDNGFAIWFVAERFFLAAGIVTAQHYVIAARKRQGPRATSAREDEATAGTDRQLLDAGSTSHGPRSAGMWTDSIS
jgi:hypothetical protein